MNFREAKIYHITHWADMDGISCGAFLEMLENPNYTRSNVNSYNYLGREISIASEKLKNGEIVIISDLCFYDKELYSAVKELQVQFPNTLIILDHHVETIRMIKEASLRAKLGASMCTVKYAGKSKSAIYIVSRFLDTYTDLDLTEFRDIVKYISTWDTFTFLQGRDRDYPVLLQKYYMIFGKTSFFRLCKSPDWKVNLHKKLTDTAISDLDNVIKTTLHYTTKTNKGNVAYIYQFPSKERHTLINQSNYQINDIAELICYLRCMEGYNTVSIANREIYIYEGDGNSIKPLLRNLNLSKEERNRNKISYLMSNFVSLVLLGNI